jgi:hypothetical protein
MTHDELLARLDKEPFLRWQNVDGKRNDRGPVDAALRAVVELHKPLTTPNNFTHCPECQYGSAAGSYPCKTIQAIEKELS